MAKLNRMEEMVGKTISSVSEKRDWDTNARVLRIVFSDGDEVTIEFSIHSSYVWLGDEDGGAVQHSPRIKVA